MAATLSKSERLCGKKAIAGLMEHGKGGVAGCLRYKFLQTDEVGVTRILVSVLPIFSSAPASCCSSMSCSSSA